MRFGTMGGMKTFNLNISGNVDIIVQVPDDREIQREEAYAVALIQLQEIIVDGTYPINQRLWPCIFCDVHFSTQAELMGHVRSEEHLQKTSGIQKLADKHLKKIEEETVVSRVTPSAPIPKMHSKPIPKMQSSEHHKEYMRQYYVRKQLGEI